MWDSNYQLPSIASLYNLSLRSGSLPAEWKRSNIVPVPKESSKSDVRSFRPISLLPLISKTFEKHIHHILLQFLTRDNLLSNDQLVSVQGAPLLRPSCLPLTGGILSSTTVRMWVACFSILRKPSIASPTKLC